MSRPRKLFMEGVAGILRSEMKPEGELMKLMATLPEEEHAAFQEAAWGFIRNVDGRALRLPNTPMRPERKSKSE